MNTNDFGSIGWTPPPDVPPAREIVGWGGELIGAEPEIIGCGCSLVRGPDFIGYANDEIVGQLVSDGSFGAGTDQDWFAWDSSPDYFGFFGLIIAGIAGIVAAVSSAAGAVAAVAAPVIAAVGTAAQVASIVGGGVAAAQGLIDAAKGGDKKAIAKLKTVQAKQSAAKKSKAAAKSKLAELAVRARQGDLKAQAVLVGIDIIRDQTIQKVAKTGVYMNTFGVLPAKAMIGQTAVEAAAALDFDKLVKDATALAKSSGKWPKDPPKVKLPAEQMKAAARSAGVAKIREGVVKAKGKQAGARGVLVLATGEPLRGNWLAST